MRQSRVYDVAHMWELVCENQPLLKDSFIAEKLRLTQPELLPPSDWASFYAPKKRMPISITRLQKSLSAAVYSGFNKILKRKAPKEEYPTSPIMLTFYFDCNYIYKHTNERI